MFKRTSNINSFEKESAGVAQSVKCLVTGWMTGVQIPTGAGTFLFATKSKPVLGPTTPPSGSYSMGTGVLFMGKK